MHSFSELTYAAICYCKVILWNERREYVEYDAALVSERRAFRSLNPGRRGRRVVPYPPELAEPKPFTEWLEETVYQRFTENAESVEADVLALSKVPSELATKYRSMWAFGNHLRLASAETHLKTCDSGVAAIFRRPCRAGLRDQNHVLADVEYVGQVHEIIEVNYGRLCVIVLFCSWIKANYRGNSATMKRDKWGFNLANFAQPLPFGPESFAFPMHVEQVFFADAREEPRWKVILRKEVRGRRVSGNMGAFEDGGMFSMGEDVEHEGLRAPEVILEENSAALETGRRIRREDAFAQWLEEVHVEDQNLGESGTSSEEEE